MSISIKIFGTVLSLFAVGTASAQNPLIMDQFTADPTARVFNGKLYVYPSHDIVPPEGEGRPEWFNMADYHVFSTENLTDWTDHGKILDQKDVPWADPDAYSMWAPDAVERNGKYYFFFPTKIKGAGEGEGSFGIGVAIADTPEGPFIPEEKNIKGVAGIDPNVLIDNDGQAYLYWSRGEIYGAKLKDNMLELDSGITTFNEIPQKGHIEGPFVFKRKGTYYLTYPHVANDTERLEYATAKNPLGPFTHQGVIMDESPTGVWTNHQSVVNYSDQWYLFYHHADLSPDFDKNRSIRADSLFFTKEGKIRKVRPTLRGIGNSSAYKKIQFDRYSAKSEQGVAIEFLDTQDTFKGWKIVFNEPHATVRYHSVDFGDDSPSAVMLRIKSSAAENVGLKITTSKGILLAETELKDSDWKEIKLPVQHKISGIKNLVMENTGKGKVQVDWIKFEK